MKNLYQKTVDKMDELLEGDLRVLGQGEDSPEFKHDPNLEDIIKSMIEVNLPSIIVPIENGSIGIILIDKEVIIRWKLGLPLSSQSPEVWKSVAEILNVK